MGRWNLHPQQQQAGSQFGRTLPRSAADQGPDRDAPDGTGGPHPDDGEGERGMRAAPGQLGKPHGKARDPAK